MLVTSVAIYCVACVLNEKASFFVVEIVRRRQKELENRNMSNRKKQTKKTANNTSRSEKQSRENHAKLNVYRGNCTFIIIIYA